MMRHSFSLEKVDYAHIISSAIREEVGKCLCSARKEKRLSISDIPNIPVLIASAIEQNTKRHSWNSINRMVNRYGYDARVFLNFNVDVSLYERTQKKTKV